MSDQIAPSAENLNSHPVPIAVNDNHNHTVAKSDDRLFVKNR